MLYKDYLNSARKHEHTCDVLFEKLSGSSLNTAHEKYLILNLYYLSGYIIECIVKYAIYDLNGHAPDQDVRSINTNGLNYNLHIKHHKFERYTDHLRKHLSMPIPLINDISGVDKQVQQLYKEWDAEVRYKYDLGTKSLSHYISFYRCAKTIFRVIKNNIGG
jgi:hypothetical protein